MVKWYLATYQNGIFSNDLGIIQPSEDNVYKLKNGIQSGESPEKKDWLRITIANNNVEEWITDNGNSDWSAAGEGLTGLVNGSIYWVYGFIVKYIIVTNSQTYYLEDLTTLNTISNITRVTITNLVTEIGENSFSGINENVIFMIPEGVLSKLNEADPSLNLSYGIGKTFFGTSTAILVKDYPYYNTFITNTNEIHYLLSFIRDFNNNNITGKTLDNSDVTIETTTITSIIIGNSVTSIGESTFYECSRLASVTIGDSVKIIGDYAFAQCTSLESLNIPDSVTSIGDWAFQLCSSLASVTIPNSVKTIGDGAFYGCANLASLNIPNSVTEIGIGTFDSNTNITLESGIKLTSFPDIYSLSSLDTNDDFTTTTNGLIINEHTNALLGVTSTDITSITIPNSVTSIGDDAFVQCSSLASVTIGDSVTSIGDYAFAQCTSLESLNIPDSVTTIGNVAFSGINSNNDPTQAKITISENTVRSLMDDDKYTSGNEYAGEYFFTLNPTVTLIVT